MSLSFQERDLGELGIAATVESDIPGWVTIALTVDDLDRLIDGSLFTDNITDALNEAEESGHEIGYTAGREYGYEEACNDITAEDGAAWDTVSPLLTVRYKDGYQQALDDIAELA